MQGTHCGVAGDVKEAAQVSGMAERLPLKYHTSLHCVGSRAVNVAAAANADAYDAQLSAAAADLCCSARVHTWRSVRL